MKSRISHALLLFSLWGCTHAVSAQKNGLCATIVAATTGAPACIEVQYGAILAQQRDREMEQLASFISKGASRYAAQFGGPPSYAVTLGLDQVDLEPLLQAAGVEVVKKWISNQELFESGREAARRVIEVRLQAKDLAPEAHRSALEAELAKLPQELSDEDRLHYQGAAAHEIGHEWLIHQYWPQHGRDKTEYGGPAPDWLDEIAAITAEPDELAELRRRGYAHLEPIPLATYLSQRHPMAHTLGVPAQDIPRVMAEFPGGSAGLLAQAGAFYTQSQAFADFVIHQSGNGTLAKIAAAIAEGGTIETWLAEEGEEHRLGSTIGALQVHWDAWWRQRR